MLVSVKIGKLMKLKEGINGDIEFIEFVEFVEYLPRLGPGKEGISNTG